METPQYVFVRRINEAREREQSSVYCVAQMKEDGWGRKIRLYVKVEDGVLSEHRFVGIEKAIDHATVRGVRQN